jgi:hypothetical protein
MRPSLSRMRFYYVGAPRSGLRRRVSAAGGSERDSHRVALAALIRTRLKWILGDTTIRRADITCLCARAG